MEHILQALTSRSKASSESLVLVFSLIDGMDSPFCVRKLGVLVFMGM